MRKFLLFLTIISLSIPACRSKIKQQEDSIYSRHLQRHVGLTVITTPMPANKEEMNLLLFIGSKDLLEQVHAQKIIDSLWKKNLIQPLTLVCFDGEEKDFGLEEGNDIDAGQHQKFNDFVTDELYPFTKKKVVIRKFNSVAIWGSGYAAISAFDMAWNNDEKIQKAGMFYPVFSLKGDTAADSITLHTISSSRKRPHLDIWLADNSLSVNTEKLIDNMANQNVIMKLITHETNFSNFLLWAVAK